MISGIGQGENKTARFHLPGLFEFYELYRLFLPLFREHPEYFYPDFDVASVYGSPADCLWGGGRVGFGDARVNDVLALMSEYNISARLTFSNSLLEKKHLDDRKCNALCESFAHTKTENGVIIASDLLLEYLKEKYPSLYFVSSTTKVLTDFSDFKNELDRKDFRFIVPDFRLNRSFDLLDTLNEKQKRKVEFLCNECCSVGCADRKACYENVCLKSLGVDVPEHICRAEHAKEGYRFSRAMENPSFIGVGDIREKYLPMGFSEFKIEGRGLGSAVVFEILLYYLTRPEYRLKLREEIYLDSMLDLF